MQKRSGILNVQVRLDMSEKIIITDNAALLEVENSKRKKKTCPYRNDGSDFYLLNFSV